MSGINTSPSMKLHKSYPSSHTDCISKLPDGVLSQILSCLPIRDAVRTCVLSKYWEFKWTLINKLNINVEEFSGKSRNGPTFVNIAERVLFHLHNVKNFSLKCSCRRKYLINGIAMLISAILMRNIKRLHLEIKGNQEFVLPRSLLNCTSLRRLHLQFETPCSFKVPVNNHFPNLKSLSLRRVKILNKISDNDTLVFNFPVLEELELIECKWVKVKFVEIHAPSLHTFASETPKVWDDRKDYLIKVYGAKIANFNTFGGYLENIVMIGSTVDAAVLECWFDYPRLSLGDCGLQVRKLLRELSSVEKLLLVDPLGAIWRTKLGIPIPRFCNLKVIYLIYPVGGDGLLELLHASPFLERLELFPNDDEYDYESVEDLPSCVVHHLEKLRFYYKKKMKPNYLVEKFLLKNGAQLKKLSIWALDEFPEKEMLEKLSMFPTASTCLEIVNARNA